MYWTQCDACMVSIFCYFVLIYSNSTCLVSVSLIKFSPLPFSLPISYHNINDSLQIVNLFLFYVLVLQTISHLSWLNDWPASLYMLHDDVVITHRHVRVLLQFPFRLVSQSSVSQKPLQNTFEELVLNTLIADVVT